MNVAIIKYNAGNIYSVDYALRRLGVTPVVTADPEALRGAGVRQTHAAGSVAEGLEGATAWAQENQGTVVVCGSLFLVGEVLALTEGAGAIDPSEALRAH